MHTAAPCKSSSYSRLPLILLLSYVVCLFKRTHYRTSFRFRHFSLSLNCNGFAAARRKSRKRNTDGCGNAKSTDVNPATLHDELLYENFNEITCKKLEGIFHLSRSVSMSSPTFKISAVLLHYLLWFFMSRSLTLRISTLVSFLSPLLFLLRILTQDARILFQSIEGPGSRSNTVYSRTASD